MREPLRRNLLRGVALLVLASLGASVAGGLRRYVANQRENERLSRRVAETESLLLRKRALLDQSQKNDALLEGEARRQLGLIGEGEIEYRFVPSEKEGRERMETSQTASQS